MNCKSIAVWLMLVTLGVSFGCLAPPEPPSLAGRWNATVTVNDVDVPFVFEITQDVPSLGGMFFNGDLIIESTGGQLDNGGVVIEFDQYGTRLEANYIDGRLEGQYLRGVRAPYPFRAQPAVAIESTNVTSPSIAGVWIIPTESSKGEKAWRFIVRQTGAEVSGAILRVDGDTGNLTGRYRDGTFVMSHFSGARPLLLEVTPQDDGSLLLVQNGQRELVAFPSEGPAAMTLPSPTDPSQFTTVRDSEEPFQFDFPDLEGRMVSHDDARFAGKVVLVSITGSWCPNCHDEAPFLSGLYKTYQAQGLEIVALSFEEQEQLADPTRLRAFIERYGLDYTFLLAGVPDDVSAKVPQAVNLNAFPTTFILGRDGRVRAVHAGFPSPASGSFYTETLEEMTSQIETLLAEPTPAV